MVLQMAKQHLSDVPDEVTHAQLDRYTDEALEGRLAYYEREALLERKADLRAAWQLEARMTRNEIAQRRAERSASAEALFKKPA